MPPVKQDPFLVAVNHHRSCNLTAAAQGYRAILTKQPNHAGALHYLGLVSLQMNNPQEALNLIQKATTVSPQDGEIRYNLGNVLNQLGRPAEAVEAFRHACRLQPTPSSYYNLANTLVRLGRLVEALETYSGLLQRWPQEKNARRNLALTQLESGQPQQAWTTLQPLLQQLPVHGEVHTLAARILQVLGQFGPAITHCQQAIQLGEKPVAALRQLATLQLNMGLVPEALTTCRRSMALAPDSDSGRMLLNTLLYHPGLTPEQHWQEHQNFNQLFGSPQQNQTVGFTLRQDKITIGILSADLRQHVIARNLLPLLEHYDRQRFAIHCFAEVATMDEISHKIASLVDGWHSTSGLSDAQVAQLIRQQGVAILLVTAGRFDRNRPTVATWRAAPLQISWHDPATSGISTMDGLLADRHLVPRTGSEKFAERILRLPGFFLHHPLSEAPPVNPLPMLSQGYPTFISCNNPAKLNDQLLTLWAKLLARIPDSRLILKYRHWFGEPLLRERIFTLFRQQGVDVERLSLITGDLSLHNHLTIYQQADLALDPFPFCGSTTTFEALWMGVPVVTLPGETMVSRWSAAMLWQLGLGEWVAGSEEEYLMICEKAVANPEGLQHLRVSLTERLAQSSLCDGKRWSRHWQRLLGFLHGALANTIKR
ncbi:MAG: tetratricopeptide repeat protein [Magnetococcales bacterium]|nr:tetratricopeptide repeat protein [Magnetococcales bacterium]NGZ25721.1 tetratricopeptide repeat protein [Magnetococcales bacterium]